MLQPVPDTFLKPSALLPLDLGDKLNKIASLNENGFLLAHEIHCSQILPSSPCSNAKLLCSGTLSIGDSRTLAKPIFGILRFSNYNREGFLTVPFISAFRQKVGEARRELKSACGII
jgi:hypothetical protein